MVLSGNLSQITTGTGVADYTKWMEEDDPGSAAVSMSATSYLSIRD